MSSARKCITILAIDDDQGDLAILSRLISRIEDWDVSLHLHSDPKAGLEQLASAPCDLVILDYDLGRENGLEVFARIRRAHTELPVILWTGRGDSETEERARSAGVSEYLPKNSVDRESLRETISGVLALH